MSSISVSEARGSMVQAQNVMRLLEKVCVTLRFMGTIEFSDPTQPGSRDGYILLFIPKEKSNGKFGTRFLTIIERDNLFDDIYACIIVRVNEAGGIDKLPTARSGYRSVRHVVEEPSVLDDRDDD